MCDIHGVLYINLHTIFSTMLHLRRPDGIHWNTIGIRLMNEIILNHIKTYYYGVKNFNCSSLREELGNKIKKLKEEIKKSTHKSKINYLDLDMSDDDDNNKRKRNDHDDEKENNRKVIIKSSNQNEKRMVIIKKVIDDLNIQQEEYDKFDHEYSDVMYDNEFEGLHLLHFSSYDIEPLEDIENLPINYLNSQIDIKPSLQSLIIQKEQIDKSG